MSQLPAQHQQQLFELIEKSLSNQIFWSDHNSDNCISTDWRVLPFWVILSVRQGAYSCELAPHSSNNPPQRLETLHAPAQSVMLIPAGIRHRLIVDQPTVADGLHIQFHIFKNLDVLAFYDVPKVIRSAKDHEMFNAVVALTHALHGSEDTPSINNIVLKTSRVFELFHQILRASQASEEQERRFLGVRRILPALHLIDTALDQQLKVERLAAECHLSRNSFTRLFKQATGDSPLRYINQKRLDNAMADLVHSDLSIAQIASNSGFCDQFHFSKTFHRAIGETPSRYRINIRQSLAAAL